MQKKKNTLKNDYIEPINPMRVFLSNYVYVFTLLVGYPATTMAQAVTIINLQSPV